MRVRECPSVRSGLLLPALCIARSLFLAPQPPPSPPSLVLKLAPADPDALAAQAYLLHEGDRFQEALAALDAAAAASPDAAASTAFARAHALYCLGRVGEAGGALDALAASLGGGPSALPLPARHLAAQVAYRQGRYGEAIAGYEALAADAAVAGSTSPEDADALAANVVAAYVSAGRGGEAGRALAKAGLGSAARPGTTASHEVVFNLACAALDGGDLESAAAGLARAEAALSVDAQEGPDGGVVADASAVRAQAVHLAHVAGWASLADTAAAYGDLLASPALDSAARAVVANNAAAASVGAAPTPDAARRAAGQALHATDSLIDRSAPARLTPALESRLPALPHTRALLANRAALLCLAGKAGPAAAAAAEAAARFPGDAHLAAVRAGVAARAPPGGATPGAPAGLAAALKALKGATGPTADAARAQLAADAGDAGGALAAVDAWWAGVAASPSDPLPPALVATRVDLLVAAGDAAGAEAAVDASLAGLGGGSARAGGWRGSGDKGAASTTPARAWLLARKARLRLAGGDLGGAVAAWSDLRAVAAAAAAAGEEEEGGAAAAAAAAAELMGPLAAAAAAGGGVGAAWSASASPIAGGLADLVAGLPPVAAPSGDALDRLEAAPPGAARSRRRPRPLKGAKEAAAAQAPAAPGATEASAAILLSSARGRKKRRPRYPAGVDPASPGPQPPVDAERWVPKWQRAEASRAKKRRAGGGGGKALAGGAQGAGKVDEALDSAARPSAGAAAPPPPPPAPKPSKGGGKKKGRK